MRLALARGRQHTLRLVLAAVGFALVGGAPAAAAPFVYVANNGTSNVSQFDAPLDSFEALKPLTPPTVSAGFGPRAVAVSPDGKSVYVANTSGDTLSQYSIDPSTGLLSPKSPATVEAGSSPQAVAVSPDGKSVYVPNTGDDTLSQYSIDPSTGVLSPKSPAIVDTGRGPWAVAVSPDGTSVYVANNYGSSVSQYNVDPSTGALSPKSPATVDTGRGPRAVAVSPDGKSAYVANWIADTVSQYNIDPSTGALSPKSPPTVGTGTRPTGPEAVAVSPDSKSAYVANFRADNVFQFSIDPSTGALSPKSPATVDTGRGPGAVALSPDGKSAYVANFFDSSVSQYSINPATGALNPKSPATVDTGRTPFDLAVSPDADVSVKVGAPSTVPSGSLLTYTIKVANAGPSSAWQVKLEDVLPYGTEFQRESAPRRRCTAPRTGTKGGTVICRLGTIKTGNSTEVRIIVKVTASANQGAIIDGATVSSVTPDPSYSNNKDHITTKVTN